MTATLALPPVLAAAVVNGLCNVAVFNGVPCWWWLGHGGYRGFNRRGDVICPACGGSGTVAPSVAAGQRIAIAAVGDVDLPPTLGDGYQLQWSTDPDEWLLAIRDDSVEHGFEPGAWTSTNTRHVPLHTRKVVGSAVATTPAVPIVSAYSSVRDVIPSIGAAEDFLSLWAEDGEHIDLDAALPWLPSDLVGKWAVLVEDAATTEQRCPTCWGVSMVACDCGGSTLHMGHPCPTCNRERTCPPVPLPDGFDPEPYTLTEQEMT